MELSRQLHVPAAILLGIEFQYPWNRGWVNPRANLDVLEKRETPSPLGNQIPDFPACTLATTLRILVWHIVYIFTANS